ncbi:MAG: 50S ribosomal protein L11 methyltransferase [Chloroflexota bacterium]
MRWVELSIEAHPEAVDAVAAVFQEHGNGGVSIEQKIQSHIEGEEPSIPDGPPIIRTYLPLNAAAPEMEQRIEEDLWHLQAFNLSTVGKIQRRELDEEDWANGWKEHFHPLKIGSIVVKPSWREWDAQPEEIVIELDPGMAFGTGLHPTTKLMLQGIPSRVRPGARVLDLGTGSGILAIPAAMLGARVTAVDISDVAIEVAAGNVRANRCEDRVELAVGAIEIVQGKTFDLVFANIIASVLIEAAPALHDVLRLGGVLLASGIIEERLDLVRQAFGAAGLEIVEELDDEDWRLVIARRPL